MFGLYWEFLRKSLWAVPALMGAAAIVLAVALLALGPEIRSETARSWLVSITMVVLTLAAGQIGPRLIRSFMRDRVTQSVLGLILYLLVVFRTIGNGDDELAQVIGDLAPYARTDQQRVALLAQLVMIREGAQRAFTVPDDLAVFTLHHDAALAALDGQAAGSRFS